MPGVDNAQEAIEQIGKTAQLRFLLADGSEVLTGNEVKNAYMDTDSKKRRIQDRAGIQRRRFGQVR